MEEKEKLNELLFHEESYWKQHTKIFWLEEGDFKTKFFHSSTTTLKRMNYISSLQIESGDVINDQEGMCQLVKKYYENIFVGSSEVDLEDLTSVNKVTMDQNNCLIEEMTFAEFTKAVKEMHPDKASGPDGLNPAFFQQFRTILGREVYDCCKEFLIKCAFFADINNTNLILIPKKAGANCMTDFCPIALCNVLYKILAKVLANRLKSIYPGLII